MDQITLVVTCSMCGKEHHITVSVKGFKAWENGELIQRALPTLTDEERELLISHTCDTCWKRLFGDE